MTKMKLAPTLKDLPAKIFISYSHDDIDFVEKLAKALVENGVLVWWDDWEIKVGDSLLSRIQEGITVSSYLVIVLSPSSVTSSWVAEELNAAFIRQLSDKRVVVLPVLLEDCDVPLFLQDKFYADFRSNFDEGLEKLLSAIEPPDIGSHGRADDKKFHTDYSIERGFFDDNYGFRITISSHGPEIPYAINCEVTCITNDAYSQRLKGIEEAGFDWAAWSLIYMITGDMVKESDTVILIEGDAEAISVGGIADSERGFETMIHVRARRLGGDPGQDILYEWGSVFEYAIKESTEALQASRTPDEQAEFTQWLVENPI